MRAMPGGGMRDRARGRPAVRSVRVSGEARARGVTGERRTGAGRMSAVRGVVAGGRGP